MNKKGITLVTVVVMIIVMIIIATVSIVAGNKIIVSSNEYKIEQEIESVKAAVLRKKAEVNMAGNLIPTGESYIGVADPILKSDGSDTIVATGWYYLDKENLEKLGVYDTTTRFIVNYDYEAVLSLESKDYLEEYIIIELMYDYIEKDSCAGTALKNKTATDTSGLMIRDNESGTVYGTNWYLLKKGTDSISGDFIQKYSTYITKDYLINFKTAEYVKIDFNYSEL